MLYVSPNGAVVALLKPSLCCWRMALLCYSHCPYLLVSLWPWSSHSSMASLNMALLVPQWPCQCFGGNVAAKATQLLVACSLYDSAKALLALMKLWQSCWKHGDLPVL